MKLIPTPKKTTINEGSLLLAQIKEICIELNSDMRISKIVATLKNEIEKLTNADIKLTAAEAIGGSITISHGSEGENYILDITDEGISIIGGGAAGAYYGIQTLRQIIHQYAAELPYCHIEDAPDFSDRGFYHDVTRGRVPTLNNLYHIVDTLAYYKINSLQLYLEDAFDFIEYKGIIPSDCMLTAYEISALDDYCYNNFIEFVPSIASFGHLYNLLQSDKYKHLCEYENYTPQRSYWIEKMDHHTIDVSNDESIEVIKSLIDQIIFLYRSDKFNISCDETFDLCRGRNQGKDAGEEYFKFLMKIIQHVNSRGKTVMMWGDIALNHPEHIESIPKDTIMLNWGYDENPDKTRVAAFANANLNQLICPGTTSWKCFVSNIDCSEQNIDKFANYGAEYGAMGILNTNWGDFGSICAFNCCLYGMVMGAEKGWNADGKFTPEFENTASSLIYDSDKINIINLQRIIGRCESTANWGYLVEWYSANTIENQVTDLDCDIDEAIANIAKLDDAIATLSSISTEDERYVDLVLACRGSKLLNKACLKIKDHPDYQDKAALLTEAEAWIADYKQAWLRDNKTSRIEFVADFVRTLVLTDIKRAD